MSSHHSLSAVDIMKDCEGARGRHDDTEVHETFKNQLLSTEGQIRMSTELQRPSSPLLPEDVARQLEDRVNLAALLPNCLPQQSSITLNSEFQKGLDEISVHNTSSHGQASSRSVQAGSFRSIPSILDTPATSLFDPLDCSARRDNPKVGLARAGRLTPPADAVLRKHTKVHPATHIDSWRAKTADGKHLYRLSDRVPHLLALYDHITWLDSLQDAPLPEAMLRSERELSIHKESPRDRTLLLVLVLAGTPPEKRVRNSQDWLAPFPITGDKLFCWTHTSTEHPPMEITINLLQFSAMLHDWRISSTFFQKSSPSLDDTIRWANILADLHTRNIPIDLLNQALFDELNSIKDFSALAHRLNEIQEAATSGLLRASSTKGSPANSHRFRHLVNDVFEYVQPLEHDPDRPKMYAYRFTKEHPEGELWDPARDRRYKKRFASSASQDALIDIPLNDEEGRERRREGRLREMEESKAHAEVDRKKKHGRFQWKTKRVVKWMWAIGAVLAVLGIIVVAWYFGGNQKNAFGA